LKKTLLFLLLGSISISSHADSIECVELVKNDTLELELRKNDSFNNCFSLESLTPNTRIDFVAYSVDNIRNTVTLYDLNKSNTESYISEQYSSNDSSNVFSLNNTNRKIGFRLQPTSKLNSNKNITVTHMVVDNTAQVIIKIDNIAVPKSPNPPGGECRYQDGARICFNEK